MVVALGGAPGAAALWFASGAGAGAARSQSLSPPTGLSATQRCVPGPAPTYIGGTTAGYSSPSTSLTVPAATQAGDLIVVQIARDGATVTPPSGFTVIRTDTAGQFNAWVYERIATGADAGQTYAFGGSSNSGGGTLLVLRGASALSLVAESGGQGTSGNSTTVTAPSVTAGAANSLLVMLGAVKAGGTSTFSTPAGMTARATGAGNGVSLGSFTETIASTGATGTRTSTVSIQGPVLGQAVLVRAAAQPVVDLTWTASPSTAATGYAVSRDGAVQTTVTPRTATTWTDPTPPTGTRTYGVQATVGLWRSSSASAGVTVGCP